MSVGLVIGVQLAAVGLALFFLMPTIRRRWPRLEGILALCRTALLVVGVALIGLTASGGQTPLSDTPNPVPAQVTSVEAGYRLYQANCAACHGVDGNGGGPSSGTTQVTPPSLRAHLSQHTDGDLFYWISKGLPGGMPAWESQLSETDRWNLVNYLRSINGAGPAPPTSAVSPGATEAGATTVPPTETGATTLPPTEGAVLVLPVGFAVFFLGWLSIGLRRARAPKVKR